jgi:hypothetical protein
MKEMNATVREAHFYNESGVKNKLHGYSVVRGVKRDKFPFPLYEHPNRHSFFPPIVKPF